jgi:hypothetical protein
MYMDDILQGLGIHTIGPSVNISGAQQIFPSKPNFCNLFGFSATKSN